MSKHFVEKKQHILVVSQYFYPEEFRINDICEQWIERGYEVTVLTGIPNYPQGSFYKGYSWFKGRREDYKGIHVIRVPLVPRGKNAFFLFLNYISFVISGFFWSLFTDVTTDKVFIFEVSPMTQALVGVWFSKRRKIPCYIYVQDLWPENVEFVTGVHNKFIIGIIDKMVDYIYKNCKKIFATSPSFVKKIEERGSAYEFVFYDVNGNTEKNSKVVYWPQYAEKFYRPLIQKNVELHDDLPESLRRNTMKIVFTGNIGYAQGLDILPKVAAELKRLGYYVEFYIIGDGRYREAFEEEIRKANVEEMFMLLGRKRPEEIPNYLAEMDVAFLSFANNPLFEMTIPAKLQSYMACGKPILAVANGETRRIIEEADCGICSELGDVKRLAEAIIFFQSMDDARLQSMATNALHYFEENFERDKLLTIIEEYMA